MPLFLFQSFLIPPLPFFPTLVVSSQLYISLPSQPFSLSPTFFVLSLPRPTKNERDEFSCLSCHVRRHLEGLGFCKQQLFSYRAYTWQQRRSLNPARNRSWCFAWYKGEARPALLLRRNVPIFLRKWAGCCSDLQMWSHRASQVVRAPQETCLKN